MHDIDRTQREVELALHELQPEQFEFAGEGGPGELNPESGMDEAAFHETLPESSFQELQSHETYHEAIQHETGMHEALNETLHEASSYEAPVQEADEMELATELLEVTNEAELDRFLGRLIKRVGRGIGRVVRSPLGRAIGGVLRPFARAALPIAGRALGTFVGGPVGGMIGGKLAGLAGRAFGLELEGLSPEDRELEVARRFVRFATQTARNAISAPPGADPRAVARSAVGGVLRHWPGTLSSAVGSGPRLSSNAVVPAGSRRRGSWIRRGNRIVLFGV